MIYWLQEATEAGAQGAASSWPGAILSGGVVGAIVGLVGVLIGQYLTQRRHSQTLRQTAELESQRAHEAALQKYFEQVGKFLIEKPLRRATPGDNLSAVVRAQTLAVLEGLDPDRKRILLEFLYESNLIWADKPVISVLNADLHHADLRGADLRGANLSGANLRGTNLSGIDFRGADLSGTDFRGAELRGADLSGADLTGAKLMDADLRGADLRGVENLTRDQIRRAVGDEYTLLPLHLKPSMMVTISEEKWPPWWRRWFKG
jgi:hypothetical protein